MKSLFFFARKKRSDAEKSQTIEVYTRFFSLCGNKIVRVFARLFS